MARLKIFYILHTWRVPHYQVPFKFPLFSVCLTHWEYLLCNIHTSSGLLLTGFISHCVLSTSLRWRPEGGICGAEELLRFHTSLPGPRLSDNDDPAVHQAPVLCSATCPG